MSTPVKNTRTLNSSEERAKADRNDRSGARVVFRDGGDPVVDDFVLSDEGIELLSPAPSAQNAMTKVPVPHPPSARNATGSTQQPPSTQLSARLWRGIEPIARDVSESVGSVADRLGSKLDKRRLTQTAGTGDSVGGHSAMAEGPGVSSGRPAKDDSKPLGIRTRLLAPSKKPIGGVAPFVTPYQRLSRRARLRELGQRGFVPLSPGKQKLRHRILPRSVIGISTMLMCVGIGTAFSGAAFYAYYDDRLAENERTVARFVEGFDQQFTDAAGALDDLRVDSVEEIRVELGPLEDQVADAEGVISLPQAIGPSVWMLETRNESGQLANGAAFAIVGHNGGTALITSYQLVMANTTAPSPGIDIVKGNRRLPAQLWAWDEERDLALVVVDDAIPLLKLAGERAQIAAVGSRVFAMSGVGGQGATASPGVLLDHSLSGLQHTVPIGTLFTGGPLVDSEGRVVGVAATNYRPYGLDPGAVAQAPDARSICAVVLECSEIKEEVIVEVVNEETAAPERGDEPVRDLEEEAEEEEVEEDAELGGATTIDPNEVEEVEAAEAEGSETETSD